MSQHGCVGILSNSRSLGLTGGGVNRGVLSGLREDRNALSTRKSRWRLRARAGVPCRQSRFIARLWRQPAIGIGLWMSQYDLSMSEYHIHAAQIIERQISSSRTREIAFLIETDKAQRLSAVMAMLSALPPGTYLVGCGPYTTGVHRLTSDPILLGRRPLPHEDPSGRDTDVYINDVPWFSPREVSRSHASIVSSDDARGDAFAIRDEGSTTGTYVNGRRVGGDDGQGLPNPAHLEHLDVVWLGPSGANAYVVVVVG